MRTLRDASLAIVCLGFTGSVVWADPAQVEYIEDPYAAHHPRGSTIRFGTSVGFVYDERVDAVLVGGTAAIGQRFDRLTVEAELAVLSIQARGGVGVQLGDAERVGAIARLDVLRFGSGLVGPNSLLSVYVEGGAAVAWNHWYQPAPDASPRIVPADTKRVEGQAGLGVALDHRLQEPGRFLKRVGWYLGWRLALAPHDGEPATVCRGVSCRTEVAMPTRDDKLIDRSMLFQSSFLITW